jgi:deoxyribose-phosphate aldolase
MRKNSGTSVQVKCAGGVRTLDDLLRMKAVGATRSGATATEKMMEEAKKRFSK